MLQESRPPRKDAFMVQSSNLCIAFDIFSYRITHSWFDNQQVPGNHAHCGHICFGDTPFPGLYINFPGVLNNHRLLFLFRV